MSLRQINKANRQKQVVANAARFFSSIGYDLTSIDMVAKRSNMSPATIYNNFENKIGLLLAVLIEGEKKFNVLANNLLLSANRLM